MGNGNAWKRKPTGAGGRFHFDAQRRGAKGKEGRKKEGKSAFSDNRPLSSTPEEQSTKSSEKRAGTNLDHQMRNKTKEHFDETALVGATGKARMSKKKKKRVKKKKMAEQRSIS